MTLIKIYDHFLSTNKSSQALSSQTRKNFFTSKLAKMIRRGKEIQLSLSSLGFNFHTTQTYSLIVQLRQNKQHNSQPILTIIQYGFFGIAFMMPICCI